MHRRWGRSLVFLVGIAAASPPLRAATIQQLPPGADPVLQRVEGAGVVLDGRLDEAVWQGATITLDHQLMPDEGSRPSEATEVHLFHDSEALYVAARLRENDAARIVQRAVERDSFHRYKQDGFAVLLDTRLDGRTAFGFIVTPAGARTDVAIFDESNVSWNTDWNAFWEAATSVDDDGWTVEMRIPFSSLRFEPDPDGRVRMGMILWRYLARRDEMVTYPAIPNRWSNAAYKPGQGAPVVLSGITARNPLQLKPYLLGGVERRTALAPEAAAWRARTTSDVDVGIDLKYNVTTNLVLDVTVNTDFAQVEADDQRFNLDRFPLFFSEKRDFFQERSDLFNFRLPGGSNRLFHSRQIGIAGGTPIPILGGVRLTGSIGSWQLGLLNMQTEKGGEGAAATPSENFGVLRLQRPVLDRGSYVGSLVTTRSDLDGRLNLVVAGDADLHLGFDTFLGLQVAGSLDRGAVDDDGRQASIIVQRRVGRGLSFGYSFGHIGRGFDAGVGFIARDGNNRSGNRTQYHWFPDSGPLLNHSLAHRFEFVWDDRFEMLETRSTSLTWEGRLRSGGRPRAVLNYAFERLTAPFTVGGVRVPAGEYEVMTATLGYSSPSGSAVQYSGSVDGGRYFGGHRVGGALDVAWIPGPELSVGLENSIDRISLAAGVRDVVISRLRVGSAFSSTLTAQALVQYNSSVRVVAPQLRLRWNPREGSDLFVVYNEALNTELRPGETDLPRLPRSAFRGVQVKYTYTFVR